MDRPVRNLRKDGERMDFPGVSVQAVDLGDLTVGRLKLEPGWRWSTHMQPTVGGDWCQARHVGVMLAGRLRILPKSGPEFDIEPDDVYHIEPGHDALVVGDGQSELIEWSGTRPWTGFMGVPRNRLLRTLLFTDLVDSTAELRAVGDHRWRAKLSEHFEGARDQLNRFGGVEIKTTGDGMLATFEGPVHALGCAAAIARVGENDGLRVRSGVHVGEVELVDGDVRGAAVHEVARIMAEAAGSEIFVSEITKTLSQASGLRFEDRGEHLLKGFDSPVRLYAFIAEGS